MKFHLVCLRDSAVNAFNTPYCVPHLGMAIRGFTDEVNRKGDTQNMLSSHPEDFELYQVGQFDDTDASFTVESPRLIVRGKDVVKPVQ